MFPKIKAGQGKGYLRKDFLISLKSQAINDPSVIIYSWW